MPIGTYSLIAESITEVVTLVAGAEYVFVIEDSYGDGLFPPGFYTVSQDGVVLVSGGGNFGSSEVQAFTTLDGPSTPTAVVTPVPVPPTQSPTSMPVGTSAPVAPIVSPTATPVASPTIAPVVPTVTVEVTIMFEFDGTWMSVSLSHPHSQLTLYSNLLLQNSHQKWVGL